MRGMGKRFIVLFVLLFGTVHAAEIPDVVLEGIRELECLKVDGKCDPYFIRVNRADECEKAYMLGMECHDNIIRCYSEEVCVYYTQRLVKSEIVNIDLGRYQINYMHNGHRWEDARGYFNDESETRAREILDDLVKRYGYSWKTLGRYHSATEGRNLIYYRKLYDYVLKRQVGATASR